MNGLPALNFSALRETETKEKKARKAYFKSLPLLRNVTPNLICKYIGIEKFEQVSKSKNVIAIKQAFKLSAVVRGITPKTGKFIVLRVKSNANKVGAIVLKEIFRTVKNQHTWTKTFGDNAKNSYWVYDVNSVTNALNIPNGWVFDFTTKKITASGSINGILKDITIDEETLLNNATFHDVNRLASGKQIEIITSAGQILSFKLDKFAT